MKYLIRRVAASPRRRAAAAKEYREPMSGKPDSVKRCPDRTSPLARCDRVGIGFPRIAMCRAG